MDFTCICCRVAFKDSEIQRMHYKTDWHRYNLMRKVADLPPVTSEEFQRRVIAQKASDKLQQQDTKQYCKCCRKTFSNFKTYENHLSSKKHKDLAENYVEPVVKVNNMEVDKKEVNVESDVEEDDEDIEEVDSDEWDEDMVVDVRNCLFCLHHSKNLVKNLKHMSEIHTFFIPDIEFCTDINGLIEYLAQKVEHGYICLWCNEKGKTYYTAAATRKHMLDKGHTKMIHDGAALAEYTDFYDYSTSYPDGEDETVDSNQEVEIPEMEGNEFQLVLPSGSVIGHRSLMRYYKQSIDPNRVVVVRKNTNKLHKVLASYRALGWTPEQQEVAAKRARDIHHMKRLISKYRMKLGTKANKLQTHFRQQVNF
ncbi:PREDICTED: zinc finger protein 622 [Nicrophorus vespilloides]|uniref:Zinc finger protein 622 n=1 Tax=Nicrophorus vespilloides TaxID=110193 RepID=A0ABM1MEH7_NICVS|nr:PREDICTED: zinc finger protein 622 [Nicrophorus vespilloides]